MLDRGLLKTRAKEFLSSYFWLAFLVCLVVTLLTANSNITYTIDEDGLVDDRILGIDISSFDMPEKEYYTIGSYDADYDYFLVYQSSSANVLRIALSPVFLLIIAAIAFGRILWLIFVSPVLIVGQARFFLEGFKGTPKFGTLFSPYSRGEWVSFAGKMFIMNLYLFFWFLLFIIPGIIKSYAYRMVPYILAEDPTLPISEAIKKSQSMTKGLKMEMFVLDLSFIGWYILAMIPCFLGIPFVITYHRTTLAKLYESLKPSDIDPALLPA